MIEIGLLTGYVIAWVLRKAKRAGERFDKETDAIVDTGMDRLHELVVRKLGPDPALSELDSEIAAGGQVSDLTRQRLELSLTAALRDEAFAKQIEAVLATVRAADRSGIAAIGQGSAAVAGDVRIVASSGSAAAWQMGDVRLGGVPESDPRMPGRSRD